MATLPKFSFGLGKKDDQGVAQDDQAADPATDQSQVQDDSQTTGSISFDTEAPATPTTETLDAPALSNPFMESSTDNVQLDASAGEANINITATTEATVAPTADPFASTETSVPAPAADPFATAEPAAPIAPAADPFASSEPVAEMAPVESAPVADPFADTQAETTAVAEVTAEATPAPVTVDPFAEATQTPEPVAEVPAVAEAITEADPAANPFGDMTAASTAPVTPEPIVEAAPVEAAANPFGDMAAAVETPLTPAIDDTPSTAMPVAFGSDDGQGDDSQSDDDADEVAQVESDPTASLTQIKAEIEGFVAYHTKQINDYKAEIREREKKIKNEKQLLKSKKAEFREMLHQIEKLTEVSQFNDANEAKEQAKSNPRNDSQPKKTKNKNKNQNQVTEKAKKNTEQNTQSVDPTPTENQS